MRRESSVTDESGLEVSATPHANTSTTEVRTAVARFESTPATPTFAKIAVNPANTAESNAHVSQFMRATQPHRRVTSKAPAERPHLSHHETSDHRKRQTSRFSVRAASATTPDFRLAERFRASHSPAVNLQLPPGGILIGLGTDVIEISRVAGVYERQGERFLQRVFTAEERAYCLGHRHPEKSLAARFAAKEAIAKAFSTGIGAELGWTSMSIYHGARHEPLVRLDDKALALLHHIGGTRVLLSLSHSDTVAIAFAAIIRSDDPEP